MAASLQLHGESNTGWRRRVHVACARRVHAWCVCTSHPARSRARWGAGVIRNHTEPRLQQHRGARL